MSPVEMSQTFLLLLFDLGLLALLVQAYAFLNGPRQKSGSELSASGQSNLVPNIILGASCGAMASLAMLNPIPLPHGAVMDPRAGPIMIAGLFAGPWGAAIAAIIGGATRAFVIGGLVAFAGAVSFALYGAAGLIAASFIKRRGLGITPSVLIGVGVFSSVAVLPSFFIGIPLDQSWSILKSAMPILVPTNIISVLIVGFALELQRRRLEALESNLQLLDENTKLSFVADKTTNGVIITDRDGRIEWVNAGFTRITGYTLDECMGRKPGAFLQGPDTDPDTVNEISDKLFRRQDCTVGIQNYHKDGSKIWLNLEIHPVIQDGELRNFVAVETDETERRRYQSELPGGQSGSRGSASADRKHPGGGARRYPRSGTGRPYSFDQPCGPSHLPTTDRSDRRHGVGRVDPRPHFRDRSIESSDAVERRAASPGQRQCSRPSGADPEWKTTD